MKYQFVILEGMDNSGKTTICDLVNRCGYRPFKSSNEISSGVDLEEAIRHDWRFLIDFIRQMNTPVVFDRSFITQWAYSMHLRQDNILKHYGSFDNYNEVFRKYCAQMHIGTLVIFCKRQDYTGTTDDKVDMQIAIDVQERFIQFFNSIGLDLDILECEFEDGIEANKIKILKKLEILI